MTAPTPTAADWISDRRALLEAATEGPWRTALLDGVDYEDGSSSYRGGVYPDRLPGPPPLFLTNSIDARDAALIADSRTSLPKALDALEAVLGIHRRVGIYDECDCTDEQKQVGHEDIYEVGLTCNRLYDVCDECCRDDGYQTEECAACHKHTLEPTCPTIRAIREALGVQS